jgi:DNA-binding beta-propeller fold protein YncE
MMGTVTQDNGIAARARPAPRSLKVEKRHALAALAAVVLLAAAAAVVLGLTNRPESNSLAIPVPGAPTSVAATGDVVWVAAAGAQAVWPIDAATGRQAGPGIRTGGSPTRLAVGGNGLWVADSERGSLIPVETESRRVFGAIQAGADVTDVALAEGAVWVLSSAEGVVRAVEPDGRPVVRLPAGRDPVDLAAGGRWIVVTGASGGTLTRIDARARQAVGEPIEVGGQPVAVAVSGDTAWVADAARGEVAAVDLLSGRTAGTVPVGRRPIAVAADGDDVYVLSRGDRTLVRVDGRSGEVVSRRELEQEPTAMALDDRYVWVAMGADREVLRIDR